MTQAELAYRARVSVDAISSWERGVRIPNRPNTKRLAKALGVTVDELGLPR